MNAAALRLLNQQLVAPQYSDPAEVVSYMGAIQAQEYRMMRWAVAMRTRKPSAKAFKETFDSGRIIRLHLMRGTWQLVAAEDYWMMTDLCAPKAISVTKGWMSSNKISIPDEEYLRIRDILAQTAADRGSATKEDFARALAERDIRMDDHRLSYHIRLAELSGLLCSGVLHPQKRTLALTAERIPSFAPLPREEALALLARKYFRSHSPATLQDFVWWSGLNISDCRKAIGSLDKELDTVRWKGETYYIHCDSRTRGFRQGRVHLLPAYDEYLIGYKSRHVVLHPDHRHHAHDNSGTFWNVMLQDGRVVGNWSDAGSKTTVSLFRPDSSPDPDALQSELLRFDRFK